MLKQSDASVARFQLQRLRVVDTWYVQYVNQSGAGGVGTLGMDRRMAVTGTLTLGLIQSADTYSFFLFG